VEKAIEVLMGEHRLIEQALGSLETYAVEVRAGRPPARALIGDYAAFFRGFADTCHHGKEEDILFRLMIERGFAREAGPLAVMYYEHELGRHHVRDLSTLAAGTGTLNPQETGLLLGNVDGYVPLLRSHIQKEDRVLYPLALQVLEPPDIDVINTEFETFEARARADGSLDRLMALAERLAGRFRPDPMRMAEAAQFSPCGR
jgi:hemerythrin-like domain-containing protein